MIRQRLTLIAMTITAAGLASGCAEDVDLDAPITTEDYVEAQFDPTNSIPVLRLVPSPSALAEVSATDHSINQDAVKPADCELPDPAECLQFVKGWPLTLGPTLYFSGALDESTIQNAVIFADAAGNRVDYSFTVSDRPAPPTTCQEGNNGSDGLTYTADDVPPGVQLVLQPSAPLSPNTTYIVAVVSDDERGLRDAEGRRVQPSALFGLLNRDTQPILADGTVQSALLRSQLQGSVLDASFGGAKLSSLSEAQQAAVGQAVQGLGLQLYPLYQLFKSVADPLLAAGLVSERGQIVISNVWTTGNPTTEISFDPTNSVVPFPNSPLFLKGGKVALPTAGLSGSSLGLVTGLNTLDGFSTLAPIFVTASRSLDPATLDDGIKMFQLNAGGEAETQVPLTITQTSTSSDTAVTLTLSPAVPLAGSTDYVISMTTALKDHNGGDVVASTAYSLLKSPVSLVTAMDADATTQKVLQCAAYGSTGSMLTGNALEAYVDAAFESDSGLNRSAWQTAITAMATASDADEQVSRDNLVMAFDYHTQSITDVVESLKAVIDNNAGAMNLLQSLSQTVLANDAATATTAVGAVACPMTCLMGGFGADADCENATTHSDCAGLAATFSDSIGTITEHTLPGVDITNGSPYTAGTATVAAGWGTTTRKVWVVTPSTGSAPYPAVIVQHGLGERLEVGLMIAGRLARAGYASVMMDLPFHGSRASDIVNNATSAPCDANPRDISCKADGTCTGGCDGTQDVSGTGFFTSNVFGVRGTMRQATFDQLLLRRQLSVIGGLDGSRLYYIGRSLGAITGANFTAYLDRDTELQASVLNVGGGGLMNILRGSSPEISGPLFAALYAAGVCTPNDVNDLSKGCQMTTGFARFLQMAQWALDPVDPLNTTRATSYTQANQLMQMAVPDATIPNETTVALSKVSVAIGSSVPALQSWESSPINGTESCHSFLLAPICSASADAICLNAAICRTISAQDQAVSFLGGTLDETQAAPTGIDCTCN